MIVDRLQNWNLYFSNPIWKTVFDALLALHDGTPEGERKIAGNDIVLKVFSYHTLHADECDPPEAHRQYLDIHTSIRHSECIEWYPVSALTVARPYDAEEDEVVYARPEVPPARIMMSPGVFALFGPEDAHRPRLHPDCSPAQVKKAVMKIPVGIAF